MSLRSIAPRLASLLLLAAGASATNADVVHIARLSRLNADYLLGAGADAVAGAPEVVETTLTGSPTLVLIGGDANEGELLGNPFLATADFDIRQEFQLQEVGGSLVELRSVGSVFASTSAIGPAVAGLNVRKPGNLLEMEFVVTAAAAFSLTGSAADTGADNTSAAVQLHRFVGSSWIPILLLGDGTFSESGSLDAGTYRLTGVASAQADTNETQTASWEYTLRFESPAAVPEPSSAVLAGAGALAAGGCVWLRRRANGRRLA